jgi:capsular exopolysaccharide synthesis family protein
MSNNNLSLEWIYQIIRRWVWVIVGLTVIAVIASFAVISWMPTVYKSSVTLLIEPSASQLSSEYTSLIAGQQLALTYSQMINDASVLETVISKLGLKETPEHLANRISVETLRDTQLIQITVSKSDPKQAQLLANTVASVFIDHVQALQKERYNSSLQGVQGKIDYHTKLINSTQQEIDTANIQKIDEQVKLEHLNSVLEGYRDDYRSLQQGYMNLQQTVAQASGNVYLAQAAQLDTPPAASVQRATATLLVGQSPFTGVTYASSFTEDQQSIPYEQLLESGNIISTTITKLGLTDSPSKLLRNTQIELVPGSNLIRFTVFNQSADQAKLLADTMAGLLLEQIKALLTEPYANQLSSLQKQMDELSANITKTQDELKTQTNVVSQYDAETNRLQNILAESRSDLRSYQQDYDQMQLEMATRANNVTIADPARVSDSPEKSSYLYVVLAGIIGAALGIALAFLLESLDSRVNTAQDIGMRLGLSTLSMIGQVPEGEKKNALSSISNSSVGEDFRILSTMIRFASPDHPLKKILITSPAASEGKSLISLNLAVTLARSGLKVVLIDTDIHCSRLQEFLGIEEAEGFMETLLNEDPMIPIPLQPTSIEGLSVLLSGNQVSDYEKVFTSSKLARLFEKAAHDVDIVIIDCPPVLALADTTILASTVDDVLLVLRAGFTKVQDARDAIKTIQQVRAHILGVVLNDVPMKMSSYYKRYHGQKLFNKKSGRFHRPGQFQKEGI